MRADPIQHRLRGQQHPPGRQHPQRRDRKPKDFPYANAHSILRNQSAAAESSSESSPKADERTANRRAEISSCD